MRPFVNIASDEHWILFVAWMVGALNSRGPYPVLRTTRRSVPSASGNIAVLPRRRGSGLRFSQLAAHLFFKPSRGGVHPKVAQQLARHSTITLTLDRYTHTVRGELADALTALPDLSDSTRRVKMVATGTDGRDHPQRMPKARCTESCQKSDRKGGKLSARGRMKMEGDATCHEIETIKFSEENHVFSGETGEGGIRTRDTGANPYNGLANRRFQPLTHLSHQRAERFCAETAWTVPVPSLRHREHHRKFRVGCQESGQGNAGVFLLPDGYG